MKNKVRQLFRDKLVLVMTVLGLLTIVAAAGTVKIRKDNAQDGRNPYLDVPQTEGILAEEMPQNRLEENDGQAETRAQVAGSSDASYSVNNRDEADQKPMEEEKESSLGAGAAAARTLSYNGTDRLSWSVQGNVILDYSMDSTIYFPTLDQYKCNPALIIQGDVSEPVAAPAEAQVTEVGSNEEIGNYVVLDLGSGYTAVCGQLKDVQVAQKQYVAKDTILGYVAEPTKYYSIEGNNVYFELMHDGEPVDALDYLE